MDINSDISGVNSEDIISNNNDDINGDINNDINNAIIDIIKYDISETLYPLFYKNKISNLRGGDCEVYRLQYIYNIIEFLNPRARICISCWYI